MKAVFTSILLYLIVFILTINAGFINYGVIFVFLIAIIVSRLTSVFFIGNLKTRLKKSTKIFIPITALVYILGYFARIIYAITL
jgi:hypothetical protein